MCKLGVNDRKIYRSIGIMDGKYNLKNDFRIMDTSRQPNTYNRCLNSKCSHLCLPINASHYRCVCPSNTENKFCKEMVITKNVNLLLNLKFSVF